MEENMQQPAESQAPKQMPPKTWLVESILVTLFCCLPFGIAGIVNASRVESRFYAGDVEGAAQASANARKWTIWAVASGVIICVLYLILAVAGVFAGVMSSM